jgi:hypothetical protein
MLTLSQRAANPDRAGMYRDTVREPGIFQFAGVLESSPVRHAPSEAIARQEIRT